MYVKRYYLDRIIHNALDIAMFPLTLDTLIKAMTRTPCAWQVELMSMCMSQGQLHFYVEHDSTWYDRPP